MTIYFKKLIDIIAEELEHSDNDQIRIYDEDLLNAGLENSDIRRGLDRLVADKLIIKKPEVKYAPNKRQSTNPMLPDFISPPNNTYNKLVYFLSIDRKRITVVRQKFFARIYYDAHTGIGFVNGERFKFKDDQSDFFVFPELYERIGKTLERKKVLELSNYSKTGNENLSDLNNKNPKRKPPSYISETYFINELVKKIRKMTGLNTNQLVNNNGNLTLVGEKLDTLPE